MSYQMMSLNSKSPSRKDVFYASGDKTYEALFIKISHHFILFQKREREEKKGRKREKETVEKNEKMRDQPYGWPLLFYFDACCFAFLTILLITRFALWEISRE